MILAGSCDVQDTIRQRSAVLVNISVAPLRTMKTVYPLLLLGIGGYDFAGAFQPTDLPCSPIIATFPVTRRSPVDSRPTRFELRQCEKSMNVQVMAFESRSTKPGIFVDLHEPWRLLFHHSNVLIVQTVGGSSSLVYILRFERGRAQQPIAVNTRGTVAVRVDDDRQKIIVSIPADERLTVTSPARTLEFSIE